MNAQITKENWNVAKGKLKQKYPHLTDDDLHYAEGREDDMIGRIQSKLGKDRFDVYSLIDEACGHGPGESRVQAAPRGETHIDMPMKKPSASSGTAIADPSEARPNAGSTNPEHSANTAARADAQKDQRQQGTSTAATRLKGNAASHPPPMPPKPSYPNNSTSRR